MQKNGLVIWLEVLRVLACFAVVLLHVSAWNIYTVPINSSQYNSYFFYNGFTRFAVAVFVMVSGCLYLDKARIISFEKLFKKYIKKFVVLYAVYVVFYAVIDTQVFHLKTYEGVKGILQCAILSPKYHLWYLPMMISLLLVTPVVKAIVDSKESKKLCEYIIVLFLIFKVLKPTILMFEFEKKIYIQALLNILSPDMVCNWIGFYVLGYYLAEYGLPKSWNRITYLLGFVGMLFASYENSVLSTIQGKINTSFYVSFSLFSTIWSVAIFVYVKEKIQKTTLSNRCTKNIIHLSKHTLGIYLLHPFVKDIVQAMHIDTTIGNGYIVIPILTVIIFVLSYLMTVSVKKSQF